MKFRGWLQLWVRQVYFATICRSCSKMFSIIPETNCNFLVIFILSTASSLNSDWSKILSFGKKLNANHETAYLLFQGWTKFYEFSLSDLRAGADIIDRLCVGGMGDLFGVCVKPLHQDVSLYVCMATRNNEGDDQIAFDKKLFLFLLIQ